MQRMLWKPPCLAALLVAVLWLAQPASAQFGKKKPKETPAAPATAPASKTVPRATGPLKLVEARVAQMEDGEALTGETRFVPGETIFFSVVVDNYKVGANGRVELDTEMEALDPKGLALGPKITEQIKTTVEDEDKDWKPKLRAQFQVPSIARPGNYSVRFKVTDVQTSLSISGEKKLAVVGVDVAPSESLVVRDFGFYRSEDETTPLSIAAYRPGDTIWARFFITGYKYGPENAIDVTYDVAVLNAEGKEIFSQKNAAVERSKALYPQPWVPGGMNLSLQKNMRPGNYAIAITARDATGNQTITDKHEFRLE